MEKLINPIAYTLLHSLWQGAILMLIYWLCSKIISSSNASLRYNLASLLLIAFVFGVGLTFTHYFESIGEPSIDFEDDLTLTFIGEEVSKSSTSFLNLLQSNVDFIVTFWFIGVVIMFLRMSGSLIYLRYLIKNSTLVENAAWHNSASRFRTLLSIKRDIGLRISKHVDVPCVIGAIKPVILFPVSYASSLSIDQIEIILAHELSHIKRHDFLVNILQSVVEILFFFNPFVWALSNIMKTEREHATDDMAVNILQDKTNYIKTLAAIEQVRFQPILANGFASNNNLITRIKRLTGMKTQNLKDVKIIVLLVTAAMIMSFGWFSSKDSESKAMVTDTNLVYDEEEKENQQEDEFNGQDIGVDVVVDEPTQTDISFDESIDVEVEPDVTVDPEMEISSNPDPDPKKKDKSKQKEKEVKREKTPKSVEPAEPAEPAKAPKAPKSEEYFYGVDGDWSEWSAEFTEKFEQQLKELEYLQEMDLEALMADVNRIVADMNALNHNEQRELMEMHRQLAEEQRHMAEEQRMLAQEAVENMKVDQLRLKEELKIEMQRLKEEMKLHEKEMKEVEEEVRKVEENIKKFNSYLSHEMVKDGYFKNEEKIKRLDINNRGELRVNDIKIEDKDADRYLKKFEEIMGEKPGDFQYRH